MQVIVGKTSGFCYGVKRAVLGTLNENIDNLYVLGELVHNETVINELKSKNITIIDSIDNIPNNSNVIFRAHGVTKETYEIANNKNLKYIDYTCPNVLRIHDIIKKNNDKFIILCGSKDHPENIGSVSFANNYYVLEDSSQINDAINIFEKSITKELLLISQTTYSVSKFNEIKDILICKYPNIIIHNTICKTTSDRQKETAELSKIVDMMIIVGGKNSSNTKKLYDEAIKYNSNVILISNEEELPSINVNKVGIMAGASTPDSVIEKIVNKLKEE